VWSNPTITGVDDTTFSNITIFKNQVWFTQNDTLKGWYLPTLSIQGAANYIDMSSVAQLGGYLVAVGTWTIDAGYGVDDNLVFITSNGEIIVYAGTDPSDVTKWGLIGVWRTGKPVGKRCLIKYGGDIVALTYNGVSACCKSTVITLRPKSSIIRQNSRCVYQSDTDVR
jgi:hypothetical protein